MRQPARPHRVFDSSSAAELKAMPKSSYVWIVDDDRSIRWVFEKALPREGIPCKTFGAASEALRELDAARRRCCSPTSACPASPAWSCCRRVKERQPAAGHHHDRVLRSRQRGGGVPGRRVRIPAQALRRRPGGRTDPPRAGREPARRRWRPSAIAECPRSSARRRRCRRCSAPSAGCRSRAPRC